MELPRLHRHCTRPVPASIGVDGPEVEAVYDDSRSFSPPSSSVYHSPEAFAAGYAEMGRSFKVYIYPDGDPRTFYQMPRKLTGKYASEGYFFKNIRGSQFRNDDPDRAHLFFVPISPYKMCGKGNVVVEDRATSSA